MAFELSSRSFVQLQAPLWTLLLSSFGSFERWLTYVFF
jgi:hypothetical protein